MLLPQCVFSALNVVGHLILCNAIFIDLIGFKDKLNLMLAMMCLNDKKDKSKVSGFAEHYNEIFICFLIF